MKQHKISRLLAKGYELYDANDIQLVKKHGYNVSSDTNE